MIIKNITIENFRSYYGVNSIDIGDGLTLIIGSNGDGKTTLFEAIEWLFDTAGKLPTADTKYISKKAISELSEAESAVVRVAMTYVNNSNERIVQKSFKFTRSLSGEISPSNYSHEIYIQNGCEKEVREGDSARKLFNIDFPGSVRDYCLFKGEQELNIFNNKDAMSYLVETFSQIKDFDPYLSFMQYAQDLSQKATDNALSSDKKNAKEAQALRLNITNSEKKLGDYEEELRAKQNESSNFQSLLEEMEKNKESSETLVNLNKRLDSLKDNKENNLRNLNENYTYRLLDDMWILMGFESIADEFGDKVAFLDKEERRQQSAYDQELGAKNFAKKLQCELSQGHVPLALNIPDKNTMQEMLDDEICKVCGRKAEKGSEAYAFMKARLDRFIESTKEEKEEDNPPLFVNNYIKELADRFSILNNNRRFLSKLNSYIDDAINRNLELHQKIDLISSNIEQEEERKKQLLAQTDGLTEEQLVSAFHNISEWWNGRRDAEQRSEILKQKIDKEKALLEEYHEKYSKISESSSAAMYGRTNSVIRHINDAFKNSKEKNKRDFLLQLEEAANNYLAFLNRNDFRGYAQIKEKPENSAEIILIDTDGSRIYNPNTALKTTMYMSLLFAVAKLTTIKHENDYPLIFDAPTSSFTTSKESDFFQVISEIKKQTIIVTKSFIIEDSDSNQVLDLNKINEIKGKKYHLYKKRPFNDKDLTTIQTIVEPI